MQKGVFLHLRMQALDGLYRRLRSAVGKIRRMTISLHPLRPIKKVGSAMIEDWSGDAYPDFVAEGTGDQHTINAAICAVKKATYDGADCVGGDDSATGTVRLFSCWGLKRNNVGGVLLVRSALVEKLPWTGGGD